MGKKNEAAQLQAERATAPSAVVEAVAPAVAPGERLLDEITDLTQVGSGDGSESRETMRDAVALLIKLMSQPEKREERVDRDAVDRLIAEWDRQLSRQMDLILHDPKLQQLEATWRGLWFLVDRTDFRENVRVDVLNVSKDQLRDDFAANPDITESGLYKQVYTREYGIYGGEPYASVLGNYVFGPGPADVGLLEKIASIATVSHAPFVAAAGPDFFNLKSFAPLPNMNDVDAEIESSARHTKWRSFRESDDARNVGLVLPRFLLRLPYGRETSPVKAFGYEERVTDDHESYLWGNAVFAFASRLTDSFAKYRWCPNIIGPQAGGTVEGLPIHVFDAQGREQTKIPTEILIAERRELQLAELGFIALTLRKAHDDACFFSANSCQKPKGYGQSQKGKDAELNYKLGTQLPYVFVISRIAHYLKVLQRLSIGRSMTREQLEKELGEWLQQYVLDMDVAEEGMRAKRPLRRASVEVIDVEGDPGWYRIELKVIPHFRYMGAFFELSLVGKLEKEKG